MKYFLDTEFIESPGKIDLLSIGIVSEDGREFYKETSRAEFYKAHPERCPNPWVRDNVLPHLTGEVGGDEVPGEIIKFVGQVPEFWGYYADYDWVVFCWQFGSMIDLPVGFPMYCRDIKQLCDDLGNPKLPDQTSTEHHALADARWNKEAWQFLQSLREKP